MLAADAPVSTDATTNWEEWPRWRGPRGDGTWHGPPIAASISESGLTRKWGFAIGGGYAGVSVAAGRVYLYDRQKQPLEVERLLCLSAADGSEIWKHEYPVAYGNLDYGNGPRAAPTVEKGRVYILGAVGDLRCLDAAKGDLIWSANLVKDFAGRVPTWGYAASPYLYGDLVIVMPGGKEETSVVALKAATGERVWECLSDEAGYATPILIEHDGKPQIICWTPSHIRAVDPRDGQPCWGIPYEIQYGVSIATPIYQEGLVLVCAYWAGSKAMRPVAAGEKIEFAWEENRYLRGLMSQPLYRDGLVYLLDKQYGLTCFELKNGKKLWDDGNKMTPRGRNPQASLVWLGDTDRAIVLNSDGNLIVARLTRDGYREEWRTKIIGETWAHPAYAGKFVYARSDTELVCYELPVK